DYGFLDSAERYLHRVLDVLRPYVRQGIPVVGMEPSCLAVFKDELGKVLPHDDDASRLARNAYHFGEFCTAFGIEPPRLDGRALHLAEVMKAARDGGPRDEGRERLRPDPPVTRRVARVAAAALPVVAALGAAAVAVARRTPRVPSPG